MACFFKMPIISYDVIWFPNHYNINSLSSDGDFCGQVNQFVAKSTRYVHGCPQLAILMKANTNNPSRKSVHGS